jgi:hypothetical protein
LLWRRIIERNMSVIYGVDGLTASGIFFLENNAKIKISEISQSRSY